VTAVEGRQQFDTLNVMPNSDLTVSATEARRSFLKLLRLAQDGRRVTITWRGKPVAELVPAHSSRS
jgi:prevent-host-death family protein